MKKEILKITNFARSSGTIDSSLLEFFSASSLVADIFKRVSFYLLRSLSLQRLFTDQRILSDKEFKTFKQEIREVY